MAESRLADPTVLLLSNEELVRLLNPHLPARVMEKVATHDAALRRRLKLAAEEQEKLLDSARRLQGLLGAVLRHHHNGTVLVPLNLVREQRWLTKIGTRETELFTQITVESCS